MYAEIVTTSGYIRKYGKTTVAAGEDYTCPNGFWFNEEMILWTDKTNEDVTVEVPNDDLGVVKITNSTETEQYVEWKIEGFGGI